MAIVVVAEPGVSTTCAVEVVTYDDLVPALVTTAKRLTGFEADLVSPYGSLVAKLIAFRDEVDLGGAWPEFFQLPTDIRTAFAEVRLASLAEKIRVSRLGEMVSDRLRRTFGETAPEPGVGLSNTQGAMTWLVPMPNQRGRQLGWQYQGGQMRLVLITGPTGTSASSRVKREEVADASFASFFDFAAIGGAAVLGDYTGTKKWLGYSPDFVYRYRPVLPATSWHDLVELCVAASRQALQFSVATSER